MLFTGHYNVYILFKFELLHLLEFILFMVNGKTTVYVDYICTDQCCCPCLWRPIYKSLSLLLGPQSPQKFSTTSQSANCPHLWEWYLESWEWYLGGRQQPQLGSGGKTVKSKLTWSDMRRYLARAGSCSPDGFSPSDLIWFIRSVSTSVWGVYFPSRVEV